MATIKKPICSYGSKCYRKNKEHLENYDHQTSKKRQRINEDLDNDDEKSSSSSSSSSSRSKKIAKKNEFLTKSLPEGPALPKDSINLATITDIKDLVYENNRMHMPDDFYDFLEFCKTLNPDDPKNALKLLNIELVGIYDLILNGIKTDFKLYYRYFYDPPEFQTVLKGTDETMLHFGYFRDDPKELPNCVATNEANLNCKIIPKGENLFSAINWYIDEVISENKNKEDEKEFNKLKEALNKFCEGSSKYPLQIKTPKLKEREKKVNAKTFHDAGICVPVDSNGFGYRDIPETYDSLRKMFNNFCLKDTETNIKAKITKAEESIQELITLTQFANDESDYGMGLELGINMFSFGDISLHRYIKVLLPVSYSLLNRSYYVDVVKAHLENRFIRNA